MKAKIALFALYGSGEYVKFTEAVDPDDLDWTRLTEDIEVDFIERPYIEVNAAKVAAVDKEITDARAVWALKLDRLQDKRNKLLAIDCDVG